MNTKLKANIWKYFLIVLTNRRNYIPILSLYFLSLPNATAQQIGLYTGIGWLAGFLLEIPSGYISDKIGHKTALVIAKIALLLSTISFIIGNSLIFFILGSIFIAIGFAFTSGTKEAILHNTLLGLKRDHEYGELNGRIGANASIISAAMIILLPLLTKISLVMPIKAYLIFDVVGVIVALSLHTPKIEYRTEDVEGEKIYSQLKRFKNTGFYTFSIFLGILSGFLISLSPYKEPYVTTLGLPIILIGSIMALSRAIWFIIGHNLRLLKKIKIEKLMLYEIFLFAALIIASALLKNPYVVVVLLALMKGYYYGREPLIEEYFLNKFLINRRFKATMLSIKDQFEKIIQTIIVFAIGFIMAKSYETGFLAIGISMFLLLITMYPFLKKVLKIKKNKILKKKLILSANKSPMKQEQRKTNQ